MALTRAQIRGRARTLAQDVAADGTSAPTNPAVSDVIMNVLIDEAVSLITTAVDPRSQDYNATAFVADFALNDHTKTLVPSDVLEWLHVYRGATAAGGVEMERVEPWRIAQMKADDDTAGVPAYYSLRRVQTTVANDIGKWEIQVYPKADAAYSFSGRAADEAPNLSADSGNGGVADLTVEGGNTAAVIVGYWCNLLAGREPAKADAVLALVPQRLQAVVNRARHSEFAPRQAKTERAA